MTVDQEGSRRVGDRVDALLGGLGTASPLVGAAPGAVVLPFERTVGDEVQAVLADADLVVALALHLVRAGGWSIGIGAGTVDTPLPPSSRAGSGSAFVHAREAVEAAKSRLRSVPLAAEVALKDGRSIRSVSFIVDENPAPVAAVFRLGEERSQIRLATHIRLDQQSDVRVVVEASDGALYMVEQLVKFAGGQASCSAPPMGDPEEILANMGKMDLTPVGAPPSGSRQAARARFELNHPNHTGMVLDQITLHYVPLRMVSRIEARQGEALVFEMTGSITLAQNPVVEFDYVTGSATELVVTAEDTDGAAWTRRFPIGPAG